MTTGSDSRLFFGLELEHFDKAKGIQSESAAIRVELDYDAAEDGETILAVLEAVAADPKAKDIKALIVGNWEEAYDYSVQPVVNFLVKNNDTFKSLKALFVADIYSDECEISWIQQGDYSALWGAYPDLQHLQIRGSCDLSLGSISANSLETLILETGGLPSEVIIQIANAEFPKLKHLELWFGDEEYGWDGSIETVEPLVNPEKFPALKYLGLNNSYIQDDIVSLVVSSDMLAQLTHLDLSMGTLSDAGAETLLSNTDKLAHLQLLDLSHHYLSDSMVEKISALNIPVDVSDQQEEDEPGERYVEVAE